MGGMMQKWIARLLGFAGDGGPKNSTERPHRELSLAGKLCEPQATGAWCTCLRAAGGRRRVGVSMAPPQAGAVGFTRRACH